MLSLGRFNFENALGCFDSEEMTAAPAFDNVIDLTMHFAATSAPTVAQPVRGFSFGL